MAREKLVLVAVMVACILELVRCRSAFCGRSAALRVLLVPGGSPYAVEGVVRYLHWEFGVRNGLALEIAVAAGDAGRECLAVKELLERDGLVVPEVSGEPCLVFRI